MTAMRAERFVLLCLLAFVANDARASEQVVSGGAQDPIGENLSATVAQSAGQLSVFVPLVAFLALVLLGIGLLGVRL